MKRLSLLIGILLALAPFMAVQAAPHRGTGPVVGSVVLNFAGNSVTGCASFAACSTITRNSTSYAQTSTGSLTSFGPNVLRRTDLGVLIEQSSTNLILQSNNVANASWFVSAATPIANAATAPDGTATASTLTEDTSNGAHFIAQNITKSNASVTFSYAVYIGTPTGDRQVAFQIGDGAGNAFSIFFTPVGAGSVGSFSNSGSGWTGLSASIKQSVSGLYYATITGITSTSTTMQIINYMGAGNSVSYTGNGVSQVEFWCHQVEINGFSTSCIPTTTVAVARPADQVVSAGALSAIVCGSQGYAVAQVGQLPVASGTVLSRNGTVDQLLQIQDLADVSARVSSAAQAPAYFGSLPFITTGATNLGSSWGAGSLSTVANGGAVANFSGAYCGSCNSFIGSADGSTGYVNGFIKTINASATKPSDAALQAAAPAIGATICQTYYVSAAGSDSNTGCSTGTPWATIAKVNAASLVAGNSVLFRGGDSFTGCEVYSSANVVYSSTTKLIVIGAYSAGNPTILSNCPGVNSGVNGPGSAAITINYVSGITVQDQIILANGTVTQWGIKVVNNTKPTNPLDTVLIQRNTIHGFYSNASQGSGGEIYFLGYSDAMGGSSCGGIQNVTIINNTLGDPSNVTSVDQSGVVSNGCVSAQIHNHFTLHGNVYQFMGGSNVYFAASGNGSVPNSMQIATYQFEIAHDIGANAGTCGGGGGFWTYTTDQVTFQFMEVFNDQYVPQYPPPGGSCDSNAFGNDRGSTNGLSQYLYAHHNSGSGWYTLPNAGVASPNGNTWGPNTLRYSVFENDGSGGNGFCCAEVQFTSESTASPGQFYAYNLTVYTSLVFTANNSFTPCLGSSGGGAFTGGVISNILCEMNGSAQFSWGSTFYNDPSSGCTHGLAFINNGWYPANGITGRWSCNNTFYTTLATWAAAATGGGSINVTNDLQSNPGLTSVGGNVGCLSTTAGNSSWPNPCPSGYVLSSTSSPYIGVGLNLTAVPYSLSVGTKDAFNNTIPNGHGTGYNIGADGGFP